MSTEPLSLPVLSQQRILSPYSPNLVEGVSPLKYAQGAMWISDHGCPGGPVVPLGVLRPKPAI
jgi:hypothetical protein